MATHVFNDTFDATIRPAEKLRPGSYSVQVVVGYRDGGFTGSSFTAEGNTAKRAETAALDKARQAIEAGKVKSKDKAKKEGMEQTQLSESQHIPASSK